MADSIRDIRVSILTTMLRRLRPLITTAATTLRWNRKFAALPNITEQGAKNVIYGSAAAFYNIDLTHLQPHIDRVGFELNAA